MISSTDFELRARKQTFSIPVRISEISPTHATANFLNVLVVDNETDRGMANSEMIGGWGHTVEWAQDGLTALRTAAAKRPDAVLLNTDLRCLDGCEVARQLRSDFPEKRLLIIGLATHAKSLLRRKCVEAGMDLVLESPLDSQTIETLLLLECAKLVVEKHADSTKHPRSWANRGDSFAA